MARAKGVTNTVEVELSEFAKLSEFKSIKVPVSRRWVGEVKSLLGVGLTVIEIEGAATAEPVTATAEAEAAGGVSFTE